MNVPMEIEEGCVGNCIETSSGLFFDVISPAGEVRIADIAHGLAHICRFGGQCERHYSVAEHSVNVHQLIAAEHGPGPMALAGLLHDAEEAYLGDMVRPLKLHNPHFAEIGHRLQAYIRQALGIEWNAEIAAVVKAYDNIALRAEAAVLMPSHGQAWNWEQVPRVELEICGYSARLAKSVFLETYRRYERVESSG